MEGQEGKQSLFRCEGTAFLLQAAFQEQVLARFRFSCARRTTGWAMPPCRHASSFFSQRNAFIVIVPGRLLLLHLTKLNPRQFFVFYY